MPYCIKKPQTEKTTKITLICSCDTAMEYKTVQSCDLPQSRLKEACLGRLLTRSELTARVL